MKGYTALLLICLLVPQALAATFEIKSSTDKLEVEEILGNVIQAISATEFPELKSVQVKTGSGSTTERQYIRFQSISPLKVSYQKNEDNEVQDFLYAAASSNVNNALFEYEMEFSSAMKSTIKDNILTEFLGEKLYIFNDEHIVVRAKRDGGSLELTLLGGGSADIINEGTAKTFTIDGTSYNVNVIAIEDTDKAVRMKVNDQELSRLEVGDSVPFSDVMIGVSKILFSSSPNTPDIAEIFIGKKSITFKDSYGDNEFAQDVKVNQQKVPNAYVKITGSVSGTTFSFTNLKYRLTSERDIYVKAGEKLSDHLPKKEGMLGNWDIVYDGLTTTTYKEIRFVPVGNNEYRLTFTNKGSHIINLPFITNKNGNFKLGDEDQDLVITEGSDSSLNVDRTDYFILTNRNDKTGDTHALRYEFIEPSASPPKVTFYDFSADENKVFSYSSNSTGSITGSGTITAGSGGGAITSTFYVGSATNNPIAVDLNGNGNLDGSTVVDIVTAGGGILDLQGLSGTTYTFNLKTERSQFEEATSDETTSITIEARSGNTIGFQNTFGSTTTYTTSGHRKAMTNYGALLDMITTGSSDAETLTISYPVGQVFAKVYIELGQGSTTSVGVSQTQTQDMCANGIQDEDETGVDCGGPCAPCSTATCSDNIKNQDETGVDCGGPCLPCEVPENETLCDGCVHVDAEGKGSCVAVGTIIGSLYCGRDKRIMTQKDNGMPCEEAYECVIGMCDDGQCGKKITPMILAVNIGAIVFVLVLVLMIFHLLKRQPL